PRTALCTLLAMRLVADAAVRAGNPKRPATGIQRFDVGLRRFGVVSAWELRKYLVKRDTCVQSIARAGRQEALDRPALVGCSPQELAGRRNSRQITEKFGLPRSLAIIEPDRLGRSAVPFHSGARLVHEVER